MGIVRTPDGGWYDTKTWIGEAGDGDSGGEPADYSCCNSRARRHVYHEPSGSRGDDSNIWLLPVGLAVWAAGIAGAVYGVAKLVDYVAG
jgi:hypothetical protein